MARPLRIEFPGAWYHVMNRGNARQVIFPEKDDCSSFLDLLWETSSTWNLECHAYCLMPNHYHLLISTPAGNLSRAMRHLDGVYTQRFNRRHDRDGHLFRGRYKAILLDADNYLLQVARYIHLNPVKAKLAPFPQDYPWSSYRFYLNPGSSPKALISQKLLGLLGKSIDAISELERFTQAGIDRETEEFYTKSQKGPILGKSPFVEWVKERFSKKAASYREIPERLALEDKPSLDRIFHLVGQAYEMPLGELKKSKRGNFSEPRNVACYLARRICGYFLQEIAQALGGVSYTGVSNICRRMDKLIQKEEQLKRRLESLQLALYERKGGIKCQVKT